MSTDLLHVAVWILCGLLVAHLVADVLIFTLTKRMLTLATKRLDMAALHGKLTDNKEQRITEKMEAETGKVLEAVANMTPAPNPSTLRAPVLAAFASVVAAHGGS